MGVPFGGPPIDGQVRRHSLVRLSPSQISSTVSQSVVRWKFSERLCRRWIELHTRVVQRLSHAAMPHHSFNRCAATGTRAAAYLCLYATRRSYALIASNLATLYTQRDINTTYTREPARNAERRNATYWKQHRRSKAEQIE